MTGPTVNGRRAFGIFVHFNIGTNSFTTQYKLAALMLSLGPVSMLRIGIEIPGGASGQTMGFASGEFAPGMRWRVIGSDSASSGRSGNTEDGFLLGTPGDFFPDTSPTTTEDLPAVFPSTQTDQWTLEVDGGGTFDIVTCRAPEIISGVGPQPIIVSGTKRDGSSVTTTLTTDGSCCRLANAWQTMLLPGAFRDLMKVTWEDTGRVVTGRCRRQPGASRPAPSSDRRPAPGHAACVRTPPAARPSSRGNGPAVSVRRRSPVAG